VAKRLALTAAWAGIGLIGTYGLLYLFTPFGLVIIGATVAAALPLPRRAPETFGVLAGPGVLLWLLLAS
jgi:hypothetical protein